MVNQALSNELNQLEAETFEINDINSVSNDLAAWCSSSCSTSSCCSSSTSTSSTCGTSSCSCSSTSG